MKFRHGLNSSNSPLYCAWINMRTRCRNPNSSQWKDYGGRGITICKRWDNFENFAADMGPHPGKGWTLDRINNAGGYTPNNCRWATRTLQNQNSRRCRLSVEAVHDIRRRFVKGRAAKLNSGNAYLLALEYNVTVGAVRKAARAFSWRE